MVLSVQVRTTQDGGLYRVSGQDIEIAEPTTHPGLLSGEIESSIQILIEKQNVVFKHKIHYCLVTELKFPLESWFVYSDIFSFPA